MSFTSEVNMPSKQSKPATAAENKKPAVSGKKSGLQGAKRVTVEPDPKTKARNGRKRAMLAALIVVLGIAVLFGATVGVMEIVIHVRGTPAGNKLNDDYGTYLFYPPDFNDDIMQDPDYTAKNLYMMYNDGNEGSYLSDGDYANYGGGVVTLGAYFKAARGGSWDGLSQTFSPDYLANTKDTKIITNYDGFDPQKIYDLQVELLDISDNTAIAPINGALYYKVDYKILKNDGLFRNDIPSDASRTQLFELVKEADGSYKINNIWDYGVLFTSPFKTETTTAG